MDIISRRLSLSREIREFMKIRNIGLESSISRTRRRWWINGSIIEINCCYFE